MDWKQLLFKIRTKTLAHLTTLVLISLTHHQRENKKQLDYDTFDYDQQKYIFASESLPEYDGFCLNDRVCFFPADTNGVACICP